MTIHDQRYTVYIHYRNWRGEVGWRHIHPIGLRFISTKWHPEEQWMLSAWDCDKAAYRDFAMKDILEWRTTAPDRRTAAPDVVDWDDACAEKGIHG